MQGIGWAVAVAGAVALGCGGITDGQAVDTVVPDVGGSEGADAVNHGPSEGSSVGESSVLPPAEFCLRYFALRSEQETQLFGGRAPDWAEQHNTSTQCRYWARATTEGRVEYDASQAAACLTKLAQPHTERSFDAAIRSAESPCRQVYVPLVAVGEGPCGGNAECRGEAICEPAGLGSTAASVCREPTSVEAECPYGTRFVGMFGCQPIGGDCGRASSGGCWMDQTCMLNETFNYGSCADNLGEGQVCGVALAACRGGLFCEASATSSGSSTCERLKAVGEACTAQSCEPFTFCAQDGPDPVRGVCRSWSRVGGSCGYRSMTGRAGVSVSEWQGCIDGWCDSDNTCKRFSALGEPCYSTTQCGPGATCDHVCRMEYLGY